MITQDNIKALSEQLECTQIILKDMMRQKSFQKIFLSAKDFQDQNIARTIIPEDYYNFRFFDTFLQLRFNRRGKYFYIHVETTNYKIFKSDKFLSRFDQAIIINDFKNVSSLNINRKYNFNLVLQTFLNVCAFFINERLYAGHVDEVL